MAIKPDMTMDDLMNLINTYALVVPATHNGERIEDFNTPNQKEICRQLCLPKMPSSLSSSQTTALPKSSVYPATLWTGLGVEYLINGEWKSATKTNFATAAQIYQASKELPCRFNPTLWKKQGGTGSVELQVQAITTDGEAIPEVVASKNIQI